MQEMGDQINPMDLMLSNEVFDSTEIFDSTARKKKFSLS